MNWIWFYRCDAFLAAPVSEVRIAAFKRDCRGAEGEFAAKFEARRISAKMHSGAPRGFESE
jgi:hypothetical protein